MKQHYKFFYLILYLFNSLFSFLKKLTINPSTWSFINIWVHSNAAIFFYKLQPYIYIYISFLDFLKLKSIKIFYKDLTFTYLF